MVAMPMPSVWILMVASPVHVEKGSLEMESTVQVSKLLLPIQILVSYHDQIYPLFLTNDGIYHALYRSVSSHIPGSVRRSGGL